MNKERIVHKGNIVNGGFDVRITEADGKDYYYHFLKLEGGNSVIHSINPFSIKGKCETVWDELPFEVKEAHYKNIYPNEDLDEYEKNCFFYGKEKADEIIAAEKEKERQKDAFIDKVVFEDRVCGYTMARIIYDNIGPCESFKAIYERGDKGKFCIDNKVITIEHFKIVSIEEKSDYDEERKAWGQRISQIAKAAGTSFEMATVVGNITIDTNAIEILKIVVKNLNSDDFKAHMSRGYYSQYNTDDRILKNGVRTFLIEEVFSHSIVTNLNFSKKFCNAVKKILNNK